MGDGAFVIIVTAIGIGARIVVPGVALFEGRKVGITGVRRGKILQACNIPLVEPDIGVFGFVEDSFKREWRTAGACV